MATHSSILAWRIPWTEETGGLQFMGSQRDRRDRETNTNTYMFLRPIKENMLLTTAQMKHNSGTALSNMIVTRYMLATRNT